MKSIAIIGCSAVQSGATRSVYELRKILILTNGLIINKDVFISASYLKFDKEAKLTDEVTKKAIESQMNAFSEWIDFCERGNKK